MNWRVYAMTSKQKDFLKDVIFMTLGSYITHVNILVDQWFIHAVRPDFLSVHVMITSLSLVCATVGRVLAQSSLAVAANEQSDRPFNTALTLALIIASVCLPLLVLARDVVLPADLSRGSISRVYYLVYCLIFAIDIIKAPLSTMMVRAGLQRRFVRLACVGFTINVAISACAVWAGSFSEGARLLGIAGGSLVATLVTLALAYWYLKGVSYHFYWSASLAAVRRLGGAVRGEAIYFMTLAFLPFVMLRLLEVWYGARYVESYGVAHRLVYLLSAPYFAGMILAARERKEQKAALADLLQVSRPAFVLLCQVPLALAAAVAFLVALVSSANVMMMAAIAGLALRSMMTVATRGPVLRFRFQESSQVTGIVEIVTSGAMSAALLWILPRWMGLGEAFFAALVIPGIAYFCSLILLRHTELAASSS